MIDRLARLPAREKMGLALALALVLLYVADLTVAKPLVRRIGELNASIEEQEQRLDRYKKSVSFEASVLDLYTGVKDLIGVSGPEQEAIEIFKNEIDEIALRNGVQLRSMRHLPPERTMFLVTYIIEISEFEASTHALIRCLSDISNAPGLLRTRHVDFSSQSRDSELAGSMVITKVMTLAGDERTP